MNRSASLPRRLCAVLLLIVLLLVPGCTENEEPIRLLLSSGDELPTELLVGIDASSGQFAYYPILETLSTLLPEDCPLSLTAATAENSYLSWDAETLAQTAWSDISRQLTDAPHGNIDLTALAEHMLEALPAPSDDRRPLLLILSPNAGQCDWTNMKTRVHNAGGELFACAVGTSSTAQTVAWDTVSVLRALESQLCVQAVALTTDGSGRTAFTLPDLGAPSLTLLVQGSTNSALQYKGDRVSCDMHNFNFRDDTFFSVMQYSAPAPGQYLLETVGDAPAVWLCFRHTLTPSVSLLPQESAHVAAGQPLCLEASFTRNGDAYAFPKDLTASCELTLDGTTTTLPLTAEKEYFYQWKARRLVSEPFSIAEGSSYTPVLVLEYPQLGALRFRCTRYDGFQMHNFAPYYNRAVSLSWYLHSTRTFAADELFRDPEGGKVTLLTPSSSGDIWAGLDKDGNLTLTAQKRLKSEGSVTLKAADEQGNGFSGVTLNAQYQLLPLWATLLILFVSGGLAAILGYFIYSFVRRQYEAHKKRAAKRKADAKRRAERRAEEKRAAEAKRQAERKRAEREQQRAEAERQAEAERLEQEKLSDARRALEEKQKVLHGLREQLTTDYHTLRRDLKICRWLESAQRTDDSGFPLVSTYLDAHPELLNACQKFSSTDAEAMAEQLKTYCEQIDAVHHTAMTRRGEYSLKHIQTRCATLEAAERQIPKSIHADCLRLGLAPGVRELYAKFHTAETTLPPMPVLVKAAALGRPGLRYLGYTGSEPGVACALGQTLLHSLPGEAPQPLSALVPDAEHLYLLPARQGAVTGYEVVSDRAVLHELNSTSSQPCTFLLPGRDYRLDGTTVVVSVKLPIR